MSYGTSPVLPTFLARVSTEDAHLGLVNTSRKRSLFACLHRRQNRRKSLEHLQCWIRFLRAGGCRALCPDEEAKQSKGPARRRALARSARGCVASTPGRPFPQQSVRRDVEDDACCAATARTAPGARAVTRASVGWTGDQPAFDSLPGG
jgi:hypothetical protein